MLLKNESFQQVYKFISLVILFESHTEHSHIVCVLRSCMSGRAYGEQIIDGWYAFFGR